MQMLLTVCKLKRLCCIHFVSSYIYLSVNVRVTTYSAAVSCCYMCPYCGMCVVAQYSGFYLVVRALFWRFRGCVCVTVQYSFLLCVHVCQCLFCTLYSIFNFVVCVCMFTFGCAHVKTCHIKIFAFAMCVCIINYSCFCFCNNCFILLCVGVRMCVASGIWVHFAVIYCVVVVHTPYCFKLLCVCEHNDNCAVRNTVFFCCVCAYICWNIRVAYIIIFVIVMCVPVNVCA